jgi:hypothetical protein
MFGWMFSKNAAKAQAHSRPQHAFGMIEALEERRMLSSAVVHHVVADVKHHAAAKHANLKHHNTKASKVKAATATSTTSSSTTSSSTSSSTTDTSSDFGQIIDSIEFSLAPTAVQTGLKSLASADSLTAPTSTQLVYLGNADGVETYTLDYSTTGTKTRITVDQNGNAVTAPTLTTTTWDTLSGTGTGSDAAAAAEITAIATALNLTAPTSTTTVNVSTTSDGKVTYSVRLSAASSSSSSDDYGGPGDGVITVDANGNPVGRQDLPFSVVPTAVQNGINNNLPTGATALASTSTQTVRVDDIDGVTLYSTTFTTSGTQSTVAVTIAGALATLPTDTSSSFSDIPAAAQDELQTLASAEGVSGTIAAGQSVTVYTEANGTVIYTVTLSGTDSNSQTVTVTLSVDASGNPTVPPMGGGGCGGGDEGHGHGGPGGGDFGAVDFGLASMGGGGFASGY